MGLWFLSKIWTLEPLYPSTQSEIGLRKTWLTNTMLSKVCFVAKTEYIQNIGEKIICRQNITMYQTMFEEKYGLQALLGIPTIWIQ